MATKVQSIYRIALAMTALLAASSSLAQTVPSAVPVPFAAAVAGTGVASTPTCTTGIATTSGSNYGDGCAPTTAGLSGAQGVAVDKYGNIYVADYNDKIIRVVYNGGAALSAAITAANSNYTTPAGKAAPATVPVPGNIYTIAGIGGTATLLSVTATDGNYLCANFAASGQKEALDFLGDGCPGAAAAVSSRDVKVDNDGNLFITEYTNHRIRVLCVQCGATNLATAIIQQQNPGVTPVNGSIYNVAGFDLASNQLGAYRDQAIAFGGVTASNGTTLNALLHSPTGTAISPNDDIFIADNLNNAVRVVYNGGAAAKAILTADGYNPQIGFMYTIAGNDCVSAQSGKTGTTTSANSCLSATPAGVTVGAVATGITSCGSTSPTADTACAETNGTNSGGSLVSYGVSANVVWSIYLDPNGNVYYTDAGNNRIKVIYAGLAPPLNFPNSTYPTLNTGYVYTFTGQGAAPTSGVKTTAFGLTPGAQPEGVGGDANGNIFFIDYVNSLIYEAYAQTGIVAQIGGGNAITTPAAGAYCNGGNTGPQMSDAYYNGCPLTQVKFTSPHGPVIADASGTLYFADSSGNQVRKFTYNPTFPATAVGSTSAAQPYAFTFLSAQTFISAAFSSGSNFNDAGSDTCTNSLVVTGGSPGTTCVINATFSPQKPGLLPGSLLVYSNSGSGFGYVASALFSGRGLGAGLSVDPGTSTTTGTGLTPNGIAVSSGGVVYVADTASKSVIRYTAATPTTVASGFTTPSGVAVDGAGNVFVADSSANTVTEVPVIGGTKFTFATGLSAPAGLAIDGIGDLFIADKGNNRIVEYGPGATLPQVLGFTGLNAPVAVAVDALGTVYAADSTHIVKLAAGVQTTLATAVATGLAVDAAGDVVATVGTTLVEYPAGGGAGVTLYSGLITPKALALDSTGNAYIADSGTAGFIELQRTAGYYKFTTNPSSTTISLTSSGTASLTAPTYTQTDKTDFSITPATSNGCSGALASGTECALTASFTPATSGTLTDVATFSSNAVNSSAQNLTLTGTVSSQSTTTALTVSAATLVYGNVETLTATVSSALGNPTSGTVNFYNNLTTLIGSASVGTGGVATYPYVPAVGSYSVTAVYVPSGLAYVTSTSTAKSYVVTAATLTVTATNASRFYNTANPTFTYTISGFVNNDTQASAVTGSPMESTTAVMTSPTGTYPITITQGTLAAANYVFTFVNGTLTITGATAQTITFGALPNVTYGVAPITLTATASSGLTVSFTATGPATVSGTTLTVTGAGQVCVAANQSGNNTYAAAPTVTQCFTVAKAALTATATSASRVYGAANPTLTYTMAGFVNGDSQVTATSGAPGETTTAVATSAVGMYPITLTTGTLTSNNYTFTFVNGTLTVTQATLTLTANNATRVYGAANPTFTGTISGQVNGDVLTETFSTTATTASVVGTYPITPSATGANVGNYTFAVTPGTLTITQATPGILLSTSATSGFNGATSITLTATLTSPTSGVPTGTVNFVVAGNVVGTGTVTAGVATLTTVNLPVGADQVTAVYSGDTNFVSVTSSSILITISPGFGVVSSTTALAFQKNYQEAQAILTITPGGRTDTLTFACQGLPAKLTCAFTPGSLPLSGLTATQGVQMLVSNSSATGSLSKPGVFGSRAVTLAVLPIGVLLLVGLRRRRMAMLVVVALLSLGAMTTISGCGTSPTSYEQATGTYPFTVTVNSGATVLQTISFTLTVP